MAQRRGADGPDRADQHPRQFDLCAAARGAGARPHAQLLHAGPAGDAPGRRVRHAAAAAVRDKAGDHFTLGDGKRTELSSFDVVLLRQDPPFDLAYITTTHLLERIHPKTLVVNDPASVRNAPEKMFVMEFPDLMPPTLLTRDLAEIKAFRAEHGDIVMKPLYGHGGGAVFRLTRDDLNFGSLYDMFAATFREPGWSRNSCPRCATATSASFWSTANTPAR